ncbi:MAG: hypothetical protein RLZZ292_3286 [Bacteroidota bacterium]|jgi:phosphoribosylformylglycinamidine synthase
MPFLPYFYKITAHSFSFPIYLLFLHKKLFSMKFVAEIDIMPKRELLDPQGKTVGKNMKNLDLSGISDVRIGKHIQLQLEASNEADARAKVETACQKLLANLIMENYTYSIASV